MICVTNFSSLMLSAVTSGWQLMTIDDSWYEINSSGILMNTLKLILLQNFSSLGWFLFSSTIISSYQLLTADDSWHEKKSNVIFIYSLNVIIVPNLSSVGCLGFWLESVTPTTRQTPDAGQTDRPQVKIVLTQTLLRWCQGLSWAIHFLMWSM